MRSMVRSAHVAPRAAGARRRVARAAAGGESARCVRGRAAGARPARGRRAGGAAAAPAGGPFGLGGAALGAREGAAAGRAAVARAASEETEAGGGESEAVPFGYTRKDVLLIGFGTTAGGILMYNALQQFGMSSANAGNIVQITFVFGLTLVWVASYLFRVKNKEMTYVKQLKSYEQQVMEKRLEEIRACFSPRAPAPVPPRDERAGTESAPRSSARAACEEDSDDGVPCFRHVAARRGGCAAEAELQRMLEELEEEKK